MGRCCKCAGGDLRGCYPDPTIASIQGVPAFANQDTGSLVIAGNVELTGVSNTGYGIGSLGALTSGADNTAYGNSALASTTTGVQNTAVGTRALLSNGTGSSNVGVGYEALLLAGGERNVGVGYQALGNVQGTDHTALGYRAGLLQTGGVNNTMLGANANASSATVSNEITLGDANVTSVRFSSANALPIFPNNADALGSLLPGALYRTGGDPDLVAIVH